MKNLLVFILAFGLVGFLSPAFAADLDNNGIENDESHVPGTFDGGDTDSEETVLFPTSADTWEVAYYPYWWNMGDTVYGDHTIGLSSVTHADVTLKISYNVLNNGGHVDLDFRIDGTTVGSLVLTEGDGTGYVYGSFDFAAVSPPFELRYYETNTVGSGLGSVSLDETGLCSVTFSDGEPTPVEDSTWGQIKKVYER
ncbi:MAG: hypothetical protein GF355_06405 [Candidatus Eisenbacteria bacterium]|nr:hypothetical protein [Candidatus Eisenbacteria bacterium]